MALLQPPPEVYELFDDIMLLSEGMPGATARARFLLAHRFSCAVPEGSVHEVLGIMQYSTRGARAGRVASGRLCTDAPRASAN